MARKPKKYTFQTLQLDSFSKTHLMRFVRDWSTKRVSVVGDLGIDRYTQGVVERISPEAPVPVVLVQSETLKLGLGANVADNLQALQAIPQLIGVVGRDRGAADLRALLKAANISARHLVADAARRTVLKERVVSEQQQLLRIDYESGHAISKQVEAQLIQKFKKACGSSDAVIIEDYAKGTISERIIQVMIGLSRKAGQVVAIDPNMRTPVHYYEGASLLTPNTQEAEYLSGIQIEDAESLVAAGICLLDAVKAEHVVITRGKEGMAIFTRGSSQVQLIPTYAQEVYDVSGAGDTVISVLVLALCAGANIQEACILGNLAAGVEVGKRGTATVSPEEIEIALNYFFGE
jgi:rfaE bifunctional protein kinase chain/domain